MGLLLDILGLALIYLAYTYVNKPQRTLPPGPKPLPLVGNITDLTSQELWLRATQWAKEFGNVVYVHVFGQGIVFLNKYEVAVDLLEKRGAIYSDKPALVMAGELCGCENMVAFTRYGDKARRQRRLMQQALGASSIRQYQPLLEIETHALLKRILTNPGEWVDNVKQYGGALTLNVVYGYHISTNDDKFLKLADECVDILSNEIASGGGIWPVDVFPVLQHLPDWFPGAGFKVKARKWKAKMEEFVDKPYQYVKDRMRDGTAVPCFCTTLLEELQERREEKEIDAQRDFDIRWTANSMYSASIDTTVTTVSHFLLAMIQYPDVLAAARAELDSVLGAGPARLPTFADRPLLPYLEAVMSEILRWGVPVPMALPHRLMEDDVYEGVFLPKGTLVFPNVWNMMRDPELFPNPDAFEPSRYLSSPASPSSYSDTLESNKLLDPRLYVFGFGRRRCPGAHLIESSLWIVIASMIATMDIGKAVDERGNVIEPEVKFDNAVFRIPTPFKCDIRPRSEQALRLIRHASEGISA